jgi:hypothetical protein
MRNEQYKISSAGWLCVKYGPYKWTAVCKLTEEQLKQLRDFLKME